jgi:hypothetical protein
LIWTSRLFAFSRAESIAVVISQKAATFVSSIAAFPVARLRSVGLLCAVLIPIVMTGSWIVAYQLESTDYSPVRQSVSTLAGHAGRHSWIVTTGLCVAGACYVIVALSLTQLRRAARVGLLVVGMCAFGIAASPDPVGGSTHRHVAFTVLGAVTLAIWPLLCARREAPRWTALSPQTSVLVAAVLLGLLAWTFAETRDGDMLGLSERLSTGLAGCWPAVVAYALQQDAQRMRGRSVALPVAVPDATRDARNSYADLLRSVAIAAVVLGHWLVTGVETHNGRYVGVDALGVIDWSSWVTLGLQVVPVFFLVGGFANSGSWSRHEAAGESWSGWVRARVLRMLGPTCWYAAAIALFALYAELAGVNRATLQQAGWAVALHLWFVAVYVVVLLCTPALVNAHRRWGLGVPAVMCVSAVLIDSTVIGWHWHPVGWANYVLVWGAFHQIGFAWQDGTFTVRRRAPLLAGSASLLLVALIWWGPYPVSMVGVPGARIENASPPSTALLAFGLAQCGLVLACEPVVTRWLGRHAGARARIATTGALTMPVYLWHMVPVVIVIEAGYPRLFGLPAVGSLRWWEQRIDWILALSLVLALLLGVLAGVRTVARRWVHPSPASGQDRVSPVPLILGVALAAVAISQLAVSGFAPHGHLNIVALAVLALSVVLVRGTLSRSSRL